MNDESIVLTLHRNIFALNERQIDTENVTAVCLRESLAGPSVKDLSRVRSAVR